MQILAVNCKTFFFSVFTVISPENIPRMPTRFQKSLNVNSDHRIITGGGSHWRRFGWNVDFEGILTLFLKKKLWPKHLDEKSCWVNAYALHNGLVVVLKKFWCATADTYPHCVVTAQEWAFKKDFSAFLSFEGLFEVKSPLLWPPLIEHFFGF